LQTGASADTAVTSVVAAMTFTVDWPMTLAMAFAILVGGTPCPLQDWKNVKCLLATAKASAIAAMTFAIAAMTLAVDWPMTLAMAFAY
jgi:hypothetical protein